MKRNRLDFEDENKGNQEREAKMPKAEVLREASPVQSSFTFTPLFTQQDPSVLFAQIYQQHRFEQLLKYASTLNTESGVAEAINKITKENDLLMLEALKSSGFNLNKEIEYGNTLLHIAARFSNQETIATILGMGAKESINKQNFHAQTPLHLAVLNGNVEVVRVLLSNGADETLPNVMGQTPFVVAISWGKHEIANLIQTNRTNTSYQNLSVKNFPYGCV